MPDSVGITDNCKAAKLLNTSCPVSSKNEGNDAIPISYEDFRNKQLTKDTFQSSALNNNINFKSGEGEPTRKKLSFFQTTEGKILSVLGLA